MNLKNIIIYFVCALCVYLSFMVFLKNREIVFLESKTASLPANIKSRIVIKDNTVNYQYRKGGSGAKTAAKTAAKTEEGQQQAAQGPARAEAEEGLAAEAIISQRHYLPPEGFLKIEQDQNEALSIEIKDKGFTIKPFVGVAVNIDGGACYLGGLRLIYFRRYGLGAAFNSDYKLTAVADRRLDDILPLFANTAVSLQIGKNYAALGFNVYL